MLPSAHAQRRPYVETILNRQQKELLETFNERVAIQRRNTKSVSNWAMIMNVSRSSLHRELKELEAKEIISYAPLVIEILDQAALQDVLSR